MAEFFTSSSLKATRLDTAIWAARLVLLCAGIISTAVLLKVVVIPFTFNLLISTLPSCWFSFKSWLSPPYIYIIINFIIITIAASSNFHANQKHPGSIPESKITATDAAAAAPDTENQTKTNNQNLQDETWQDMNMIQQEEQKQESKPSVLEDCMDPSEEVFLAEPNESSIEEMLQNQAAEMEPVYEDDTLDATWKAIMDGQGKMVTKQLKKSETWVKRPKLARTRPNKQEADIDPVASAKKEFTKSNTFNDSVSLRKEKSMTQDELKQRAESFIRTMKLQRLESEQRLIKMVNRGVY